MMNRRERLKHRWQELRPMVAPSMLKCDFGNLHREISLLESAGAALLHLDVMDGHFVPNLSYGPMVIQRMRELTDLPFDAHLMISNPEKYLESYIQAGCNSITVHIEAVQDPGPILQEIRNADVLAGLALNPGTAVEQVQPFISDCDLILVMSVEPGFGGQAFQPVAVGKLRELRELGGPEILLSVDGGISPDTIIDVAEAGADIFVAGSSIFDTPDYSSAIDELASLAGNSAFS